MFSTAFAAFLIAAIMISVAYIVSTMGMSKKKSNPVPKQESSEPSITSGAVPDQLEYSNPEVIEANQAQDIESGAAVPDDIGDPLR